MASRRGIMRSFDKRFRKNQRVARFHGIRAGRASVIQTEANLHGTSMPTRPFQPTFVKAKYNPEWNKGYVGAIASHQRATTKAKSGWWKTRQPKNPAGGARGGQFVPRQAAVRAGFAWGSTRTGSYDAAAHPRDWMGRWRRK